MMTQTKNNGHLAIFLQMIRKSLAETRRNDPMRMAGATAFFTTFALPPIFIILFQLFSLFLSKSGAIKKPLPLGVAAENLLARKHLNHSAFFRNGEVTP
jgi:uncharacterized BrkB/YihY/UPF0761 family membrane protein